MSQLSREAMERMRVRIAYASDNPHRPTMYMDYYVEDMTELLRVINAKEQRERLAYDIAEALS